MPLPEEMRLNRTDHGDTSQADPLPRLSQADELSLPSHLEKLADRARLY